MTQIVGERYKVESLCGTYGLNLSSDQEESILGARDAIDKKNEEREKEGFNKLQFLILKRSFATVKEDNGQLIMRSSHEVVIEVYPGNI